MNCKKIQRLLLTDYLDGESDRVSLDRIRQHMANCVHCKQFEQEIQGVRDSFERARYIEPPARVWGSICEKITAEQMLPQGSLFAYMIERLREFMFVHKPVFITATAFATITIALLLVHQIQTEPPASNDVAVFMIDEENGAIDDFGTDVEKYFL